MDGNSTTSRPDGSHGVNQVGPQSLEPTAEVPHGASSASASEERRRPAAAADGPACACCHSVGSPPYELGAVNIFNQFDFPVEPRSEYCTARMSLDQDYLEVDDDPEHPVQVTRSGDPTLTPFWFGFPRLCVGRLVDGRAYVARLRDRASLPESCRVYASLERLMTHLWRGPNSHPGLFFILGKLDFVRLDVAAVRRVDHRAPEPPGEAQSPSERDLMAEKRTVTAFVSQEVTRPGKADRDDVLRGYYWPTGWNAEDAKKLPAPPKGLKYLHAWSHDPHVHMEVRERNGQQRVIHVKPADAWVEFDRFAETVIDRLTMGRTADGRFYYCEDNGDTYWCCRIYPDFADMVLDMWHRAVQDPTPLTLLYKMGFLSMTIPADDERYP
ncbi:MAG TPA: hypothetical protein VGN72_09540 [Tepidisphaeraceae bacterium]|nr:hypothetical protein [Tepidisphaeraceae bacterium]